MNQLEINVQYQLSVARRIWLNYGNCGSGKRARQDNASTFLRRNFGERTRPAERQLEFCKTAKAKDPDPVAEQMQNPQMCHTGGRLALRGLIVALQIESDTGWYADNRLHSPFSNVKLPTLKRWLPHWKSRGCSVTAFCPDSEHHLLRPQVAIAEHCQLT